ncbi:MAG: helix-turn-helix transcriptional regulator [Oscillospiraceae bacterium]|nr:helix-turn-helix transcriptional regulator [Oscillospiraceae bacterium]
MEITKSIVAKNIGRLRQASGMTQAELAAKLNYSDKAVSKWERGESLPDVAVLAQIADLFQVSLDWLVRGEVMSAEPAVKERSHLNRVLVTVMSVVLVWLVAALVFMVIHLITGGNVVNALVFIYAVPASLIVWLVFNSIWFKPKMNFIIISLLVWSLLVTIQMTILPFGYNVWPIYILGIPGQIIIFIWSKLK